MQRKGEIIFVSVPYLSRKYQQKSCYLHCQFQQGQGHLYVKPLTHFLPALHSLTHSILSQDREKGKFQKEHPSVQESASSLCLCSFYTQSETCSMKPQGNFVTEVKKKKNYYL